MIVIREDERLYAKPFEFNAARVMSELANIVKKNGGKVKPLHCVLLSDRNIPESEPIKLSHTSYITFSLNKMYYYFQIDSNFLFPFYYIKTPIKDGKRSKEACLSETPKKWLFDCFFASNCPEANIKDAAKILYDELINAEVSVIKRDYERCHVPNQYNDGYHYETVFVPERMEAIDF